jgi:hypothetical protein
MKPSYLFIGMEIIPPKKMKDSISCFITEIKDDCVIVDIVDTRGLNKLTPQTMVEMKDLINNWRMR